MRVFGKGEKRILIIGEAPGKTEDSQGRPFCPDAPAGGLLHRTLAKLGIDLGRDCWMTNSLICWPHEPTVDGNGKKNRTPKDVEIAHCRPNLVNVIKELKPEVIIPLGQCAVKSLIGWLWREDVGQIGRWVGWRIPVQSINAWVLPMWHPSFLLRNDNRGNGPDVAMMLWEKHLKTAVKKVGSRPWAKVPDYREKIQVVMEPDRAAAKIRSMIGLCRTATPMVPVAWDIETTGLKPDNTEMEIVSCAMSNGDWTFAYPWHGETIKATIEFIQSEVPKIGFNIKYEHRWVKAKLGIAVKNWLIDGMLSSHVLDNRSHICSLAFQSFVMLGVNSYKDETQELMKADNSNAKNRIKEIPLDRLLLRNGLDALLEWKVGMIHLKKLGMIGIGVDK